MKTNLLTIVLFSLSVLSYSQAPTNDDCIDAEVIIGDFFSTSQQISYDNTDANTSVVGSCDNANFTWLDTWFSFTMPANGNIRITGSFSGDSFTLYDGCSGTELQCDTGNQFFLDLVSGTTYYIRAASRDNLTSARNFFIQGFNKTLNDECVDAEVLTLEIANNITVNYSNAGSTEGPQGSCDNSSSTYLDNWYTFTMPVDGNVIITGAYSNDIFTLYDACSGNELHCGLGSENFLNLTANTTYTLRIASRVDLIANRSFNISAYNETVNNDCDSAISIPIETSSQINTQYNNSGSTASIQSSCENQNSIYQDMWFTFTMPITGNVRITNTYTNDYFTLYDSCEGTELECGIGNEYYFGLIQGTTYTLRVASRSDLINTRSFNIQAFLPVDNDLCSNSLDIPIEIANQVNIQYNNSGATQDLLASCENANNLYLDSWYTFTMPVTGNVRIVNAYANDYFTLYDSCEGSELQCGIGNEYYYSLTQGTLYTLRVSSRIDLVGDRSFNIQAFEPTVNDECLNAISLSVTTANSTTINYSNQGSTTSTPQTSCGSSNSVYLDQWFSFNMPVTGNIEINNAYTNDYFTLYDACEGTEIQCGFGNENYIDLIENTNYVLRLNSRQDLADDRSFNIQAFGTVSNDECMNAETIILQTSIPETITFNTSGATALTNSSCENSSFNWFDIWYQFSMPVNGNVFINSTDANLIFTLYDSCDGTELQCNNNEVIYLGLTQNTNYVLKVSSREDLTGVDSFTIQSFATITNNDCASAATIEISGLGECSTLNNIIDLRGATPANALSSCNNPDFEFYDAWYTFVAPLTGIVNLSTTTNFDNYALYDACSGNELTCFNNDGDFSVINGNTYYLQLLKRTLFIDAPVTFCLEGNPFVAPGIADACETLPSIEISTAQGNTNDWVQLLDTSGNIVAEINANGNELGTVGANLFIDLNDVRMSGSQPYLRREVSITPQNQPSTDVDVRLYLLEDEIEDLITVDNNLSSALGLDFMKVDGSDCTTGYSGGGDFISGSVFEYKDDYYIQASISSFSIFYPTSTNLSSTLTTQDFDNNLGLLIYPTISNGILNIKAQEYLDKTKLSIFDINRKLVQFTEIELGINPTQIDLKGISKGLYFLRIETDGNIKTQKIILK